MCPSGRNPEPVAVTAAEMTSDFRPAFDVLDADHDGKISRDDLRTFYSGFSGGAGGQEDMIGSMISAADSNKNGFVEYAEFEKVLESDAAARSGSGGVMEEVFRVMDRDGDGKVGLEDLRSYMEWAGFAASEDDIRAMIKLGGGDEREGVSYDGLLKILAVDF